MGKDAYFEYTIKENDTLGLIAQRFYGTYEDNLLQILKSINNLESIHSIYAGNTLLLPYFYQYGVNTLVPESDQCYMLQIKQGSAVNPVEFHHTELENEPVTARRFIYCWQKDIPMNIDKDYFENTLLVNLENQSDKDKLNDFYPTTVSNTPIYSSSFYMESPWTSNPVTYSKLLNSRLIENDDEREELFEILKKADYPVWKNKGLLMTDDWGQPWRIQEYINECSRSGYFKYVASNYSEEVKDSDTLGYGYAALNFEGENKNQSDSLFLYTSDEEFTSEEYFAFYTPKEIEEIHFIEKAGDNPENCESEHFTSTVNLDKREYFYPGQEYIFAFAPLDVIWARDEYVNIEKYPEIRARNLEGVSSADPLDYVKNVIKRTNFGEIVNHPPGYYTTADWDPEELVEQKLAQRIIIPEPEDGTYTKKAIKISLEPTIHEYISLLQKYSYEFEKTLKLHIKSANYFSKLDAAIGEIDNLTDLMKAYPNSDNINNDYYTRIDSYKERLKAFQGEVNDMEVAPGFSSVETKVDHWRSSIPQEGQDALELIENEKPTEFIELSDRLKKIEDFLDMPQFNSKLDEYLGIVSDQNYQVEIDYFSFRHPLFTPVETIINTFINISHHPDHDKAMGIYKKYVKPLESVILASGSDSDQQEFHNEVTKQIMIHLRDFSMSLDVYDEDSGNYTTEDVKMYSNAATNGFFNPLSMIEGIINGSSQYMDAEDQANVAALRPSLLQTIWSKGSSILLSCNWQNQLGADSLITKLIKVYQLYRIYPLLNGTSRMYQSVVHGNYQLTMNIMAKTYGAISRGTFSGVSTPNKRSVVRAYMEVAATDYYKNLFLRTKFVRRKPGNIGFVRNQLNQDLRFLQNELDERICSNIVKAPPWITTGFSSFQLVVSIIGIVDFFGKIGENTWIDYVKLLSSLSNGALALTGFHIRHIMKIVQRFPRFRTFTLRTTRAVIRNATRIGGILTIVSLITEMVICSAEAVWNYKTGDYFMMTMNIVRASLCGLGATVWIMQLTVPAAAESVATFLVGGSLVGVLGPAGAVGLVTFVIMLLIMLIIYIRNQFKTGTRNIMELLVNQMLKTSIERVEHGSEFHDQTTLYNLSTMWRRTEDNKIETFPPISPYTEVITGFMNTMIIRKERVITYEIKRNRLRFTEKNGAYNYGSMRYKPLNYRYSVPAMVFHGWPLDMIKKLHETGWGDSHAGDEDDDSVLEKVERLVNYWTNIQDRAINANDEDAKTEIQYMKNIISTGETLNDVFFSSMLSGAGVSGGAH